MTWINFLHLYQPANSDPYIIEEATEASYKRLISILEANPDLCFSLNITGCLVLRWRELGYVTLIKRIKKLVSLGQIELTGSVAYHCLTPLIPETEVIKQIQENSEILRKNFGSKLKLAGFFLPEMAYSPQVAKLIKKQGFTWIILDEIAYSGRFTNLDNSFVYKDQASNLKVIFRSRKASNSYVPEIVWQKLNQTKPEKTEVNQGLSKKKTLKQGNFLTSQVLITATDGELYGLRHNDPEKILEQVVGDERLVTKTISQFIQQAKFGKTVNLKPCNWESTVQELDLGLPYASWLEPNNPLQTQIWELAYLALETIETYISDPNHNWARWHLVRGLASCTFWWASARDFAYIYGPHAWNPDEVERGVNELVRAIRSLDDVATRSFKLQAETKYIKIKECLWQTHWDSYWKINNKT